jgi:hypothetical protein
LAEFTYVSAGRKRTAGPGQYHGRDFWVVVDGAKDFEQTIAHCDVIGVEAVRPIKRDPRHAIALFIQNYPR